MMPTTRGRGWPTVISVVLGDEQMRRRGLDPSAFAAQLDIGMALSREKAARGREAKIARVRLTYLGLFRDPR
jgi:hypothetical protein